MIACLAIPYFATAVERRDDTSLAGQSLVLGGRPWEPKPLYAFSQEAAQRGVTPGMSLRLAHVLSPQAHFLPAAPARYCGAASEIVDVLTDFTHLLEAEELWPPAAGALAQNSLGGRCLPARYYLDLESLPAAEALSLAQEIGRTVRRQTTLAPALGLAPSKFAAQTAATMARSNHVRPVGAEEESGFLAACPVHCLPLEPEAARRLHLLGVRTLGQLADLPAGALRQQFGPVLESYRRLAQGYPGSPGAIWPQIRPLSREQPVQVVLRFATPVSDRATLEAAVRRLAAALAGRLQAAALVGQSLCLAWANERGKEAGNQASEISRVLRRPTSQPAALTAVLLELIGESGWCGLVATGPDNSVTLLRLTMAGLTPDTGQQLSLFTDTAVAGQAQKTLANLAAKYGAGCFYRPIITDPRHPLPERRFQLQEVAAL
jgi:nucleotidyltransferase/DNA polymerase involved in DNA repair